MLRWLIAVIGLSSLVIIGFLFYNAKKLPRLNIASKAPISPTVAPLDQLAIVSLRQRSYPGSDIKIEKELPDGSNYHQYITSYMSDGLKIYALLTVPTGDKPNGGWPVILFNHGYIDPSIYQTYPTSGQYATYFPSLSSNGYIVFKPDYRGNGDSEGKPEGAYYSPAYTIDDLNALASIKKYKDANPQKIGVWGHSLGGNITLRDLVVNTKDIKVAVIWGGVVGTYEDLFFNWVRAVPFHPGPRELTLRNSLRQQLVATHGDPRKNPTFWNTLDPNSFLKDISAPIQVDVGGSDEEVPAVWSESLRDKLQYLGKTVEFYEYAGDNHNISANFSVAMKHSLDFFDKYLKN